MCVRERRKGRRERKSMKGARHKEKREEGGNEKGRKRREGGRGLDSESKKRETDTKKGKRKKEREKSDGRS